MNKPKLYVLIGISSSGKSTVAKELVEKENTVIISSDAIRAELCRGNVSDQSKNEEVLKIFHSRIKENLLAGNSVITDATTITIKSRKAILECAKGIDCEKIAYIIPKTIEQCIRDNKNNDRTPVPDGVIERQVFQFEIPFYEEGFDEIIIYEDIAMQYFNPGMKYVMFTLMIKIMRKFDQQNPHHTQSLWDHCQTVFKAFKDKGYTQRSYLLAAELHDFGKLFTQTFDENGIAHYYGHHNYGAYYILTHMRDLYTVIEPLAQDELLDMLFLINYHMLPFFWEKEKTHEKYKRIFGEEKYQMLIDFNKCDKIRP